MSKDFYISMICLILNWFFYDPSRVLQLFQFVGTLSSLVYVVFNNFLFIDATDRSKISSDQNRLFIAVSLYPLSFFVNTPVCVGENPNPKLDTFLGNLTLWNCEENSEPTVHVLRFVNILPFTFYLQLS